MEQPLTLHWQSSDGYFTALLTPDLFGAWVLVTASGNRRTGAGRVHHAPIPSYEEGVEAVHGLRRKLRGEGYSLCSTGFMELADFNPHSPENRGALSGAVMRVFGEWDIGPTQQAALLNVTPSALEQYLDGIPLADEPELLVRTSHILAIHKALRHLHPDAPSEARLWAIRPNPRFENRPPLDVMLSGLDGLALVRRHLGAEADVLARGTSGSARPDLSAAGCAT